MCLCHGDNHDMMNSGFLGNGAAKAHCVLTVGCGPLQKHNSTARSIFSSKKFKIILSVQSLALFTDPGFF